MGGSYRDSRGGAAPRRCVAWLSRQRLAPWPQMFLPGWSASSGGVAHKGSRESGGAEGIVWGSRAFSKQLMRWDRYWVGKGWGGGGGNGWGPGCMVEINRLRLMDPWLMDND